MTAGRIQGEMAVFIEDSNRLAVLVRDAGVWNRQATLSPSCGLRIRELALDGDTIIATGTPSAGQPAAYVFTRSGAGWRELALPLELAGAVAIDSDVAAIFHRGLSLLTREGGVWSVERTFPTPDRRGVGAFAIDQGTLLAGSARGEVRDLLNSATLTTLTVESPRSERASFPTRLAVVSDVSGNGMPELAVINENSMSTGVHDSLTGAFVARVNFARYVFPQTLPTYPDLDGNGGPELLVLGDNRLPGQGDKLELRDPLTGSLVREVWLGSTQRVLDHALIADRNGNGTEEVAVLQETDAGARNVQIRDPRTRRWLGSVDFTEPYTPFGLEVVGDVNGNGSEELALLGTHVTGGDQKVVIKDGRTGATLSEFWFDRSFPARDFLSCGDLNRNGTDDLAFLGYRMSDGRNKVTTRDGRTRERVALVWF